MTYNVVVRVNQTSAAPARTPAQAPAFHFISPIPPAPAPLTPTPRLAASSPPPAPAPFESPDSPPRLLSPATVALLVRMQVPPAAPPAQPALATEAGVGQVAAAAEQQWIP